MIKLVRNYSLTLVACAAGVLTIVALAADESKAMSQSPPMEETRANLDAKLDLPPASQDPAKYIGDLPGNAQIFRIMDYELGVACYGILTPKGAITDKLTCVQVQPY